MIEDFNRAIRAYQEKWQALLAGRKDKAFFERLKPTAVCWKAENMADFDRRLGELREHADRIHLGWINERWLATVHLKQELAWGIQIAKVYQRRPGSTDAAGLDHIDFYAPNIEEDVLADEPNLTWSHESNHEHCSWISLWFAGAEVKLREGTTIDVVIAELHDANKQVLGV